MARNDQLRDSMLLDQLVTLGRAGAAPIPRDLGTVAGEFAGLHVDKDDPCRRRYGKIRQDLEQRRDELVAAA